VAAPKRPVATPKRAAAPAHRRNPASPKPARSPKPVAARGLLDATPDAVETIDAAAPK
jgi:hypothetical protein